MANELTTFRERRVYEINGYPAVTWPEHPTARGAGGYVYVHRAVAYELWGDSIFAKGMEVHHRNGDKWDWTDQNLELLDAATHRRTHSNFPVPHTCAQCGTLYGVKASVAEKGTRYCGRKCQRLAQRKIEWPGADVLLALVTTFGYEGAGRRLGVTGNAVRKHIRTHLSE